MRGFSSCSEVFPRPSPLFLHPRRCQPGSPHGSDPQSTKVSSFFKVTFVVDHSRGHGQSSRRFPQSVRLGI